jgi:hypothetical protein
MKFKKMKNHRFSEATIREMLNINSIQRCKKCNTKRIEVSIPELPIEMQQELKKFNEKFHLLSCGTCKEYTYVFEL